MKSQEHAVLRIVRLTRRAERRTRLSRSLDVTVTALGVALCLSVIDVALRKVGLLGELGARGVLIVSFAGVLCAGAAAWMWPLPEYSGARSLDRFYGLHDGLANALAFAARPLCERTPFMAAAIEDAIRSVPDLRPRAAIPILVPRSLLATAVFGAVLAAVMLLEVRRHVPVAHATTLAPMDVSPDDIDDVRDFLAQLASRSSSDETKSAIEELNRLLSDIASRRVDRTEAFRRIEALEMKLAEAPPIRREALARDLSSMGEALSDAALSRSIGKALRDDDLGKARDALRELAKKVRGATAPADKAKLDELRDALKKASDLATQSRSALERHRQQLADEIDRLKARAGDGGADEDPSRLQKDRQELERLDRDLGNQSREDSQLERLDRELQQAAQDLAKDLGMSSRDLDESAADLNRLNEQQLSQQEKEELRQRLTELRELLRQQAAGGKGQLNRLKRFGRVARGQSGSEGAGSSGGSGGQPGDGQPSGSEGKESKGAAKGEQEGETWILGANGQKILMLTEGRSSAAGGAGQGAAQRGWGEGHDPHVQGAPTNAKMSTEDTQVPGTETGQGGSRSQVILGASARGFSSRSYRDVFTEYHQVAEESLAHDEIPGGYRFYVKRYFQLIRPREEP
jgi:hypothetical protein